MAQQTHNPQGGPASSKRPINSPGSAKQRAQFPSVGMTLRSYQYDSNDYYKVPAGKGVKVRASRLKRLKENGVFKKALLILAVLLVILGGWVGVKFIYN